MMCFEVLDWFGDAEISPRLSQLLGSASHLRAVECTLRLDGDLKSAATWVATLG
jgi:hypothetical protein